jgi:hypothetical protein
MPYGKRRAGGKWEVFNKETGKVKGTHDDEDSAKKQLAALTINVEKTVQAEIISKDATRRQVWGYAKISKVDGELVADSENDVVDTEELEKAAFDFVQNSRAAKVTHGKDSQAGDGQVAELIESIVVTPEKLEAIGVPAEVAKAVPEGWFLGFQVKDDDTWARVESGELGAFSIGGSAVREPVEES